MIRTLVKKRTIPEAACIGLVGIAWIPILFVRPMMHDGTVLDQIILWSGVALGTYFGAELVRCSNRRWSRIIGGVTFAIYGSFLVVGIYYSIELLPTVLSAT